MNRSFHCCCKKVDLSVATCRAIWYAPVLHEICSAKWIRATGGCNLCS